MNEIEKFTTQEIEEHRALLQAIGLKSEETNPLTVIRKTLKANLSLDILFTNKMFNYDEKITSDELSKIFQTLLNTPGELGQTFGCLLASKRFIAKLPESSIRAAINHFTKIRKFEHIKAIFSSEVEITDRMIKNLLEEKSIDLAIIERIFSIQSVKDKIKDYLERANEETFYYHCKGANAAVANALYTLTHDKVQTLTSKKITTLAELQEELKSKNGEYIKLLMKFPHIQTMMNQYKEELYAKDVNSTYSSLEGLNDEAIKELFKSKDDKTQTILKRISEKLNPQYLENQGLNPQQIEDFILNVSNELLKVLYEQKLITELLERYINHGQRIHDKLLYLVENGKSVLFQIVITKKDIIKIDSNPAEVVERLAAKKEYTLLEVLFRDSAHLSGRAFDASTPQYEHFESIIGRVYQNAANNGHSRVLTILNEHAYPYIKNKSWSNNVIPPESEIQITCKALKITVETPEPVLNESLDIDEETEATNEPTQGHVSNTQVVMVNTGADNTKPPIIYKSTGVNAFVVVDTVYHLIAGTVHAYRGASAIASTVNEFRQFSLKENPANLPQLNEPASVAKTEKPAALPTKGYVSVGDRKEHNAQMKAYEANAIKIEKYNAARLTYQQNQADRALEIQSEAKAAQIQKMFEGTEFGMAVGHYGVAASNIVQSDFSTISLISAIATSMLSCATIVLTDNIHIKAAAALACKVSAGVLACEIGFECYDQYTLHKNQGGHTEL